MLCQPHFSDLSLTLAAHFKGCCLYHLLLVWFWKRYSWSPRRQTAVRLQEKICFQFLQAHFIILGNKIICRSIKIFELWQFETGLVKTLISSTETLSQDVYLAAGISEEFKRATSSEHSEYTVSSPKIEYFLEIILRKDDSSYM